MTTDELLIKLSEGRYDLHWVIKAVTENVEKMLAQEPHRLYASTGTIDRGPIELSHDISAEVCRELKESLVGTYKLYLAGHLYKKNLFIGSNMALILVLLSDSVLKSFLSKISKEVESQRPKALGVLK